MVIPTDAATREQLVWEALAAIPDPEIPAISLVDLGVIGEVRVDGDGALASVELLPTFVGCPAIDVMQQQIGERLTALDVADEVEVRLTFTPPWTSDRITPEGRDLLARLRPKIRELVDEVLGEAPAHADTMAEAVMERFP